MSNIVKGKIELEGGSVMVVVMIACLIYLAFIYALDE